MTIPVIINDLEIISILHVDDDKNQLDFLNYFLEENEKSMKVTSTTDVYKALEIATTEHIDCVITDYKMPTLNGIEFSRLIREKSNVPIIIYTGQGSEEVAEEAFLVGIDDYFRKEIDPSHYQVLAKRIKHVVEKRRTEMLYQSVVEQTSDAITIVVNGKIIFANQAMAKIMGVKNTDELIGLEAINLAYKPDRILAKEKMDEYLNGQGKPSYYKYRIKQRNGEIKQVETSVSLINYHGRKALLTFIRDVTEKVKLEEERRLSEERLRAVVDLAPDGIATVNLKGIITSVNPAFTRVTGFTKEEVLGKNFLNLASMKNQDVKRNIEIFVSILRGKLPPPTEFMFNKKDGTPGWGEAHLGFIRVGEKRELLAFLRDKTESKKVEEEWQNYTNQIDKIAEKRTQELLEEERVKAMDWLATIIDQDLSNSFIELKNSINTLKHSPDRLNEILNQMEKKLEHSSTRFEEIKNGISKTKIILDDDT